MKHSVNEQTDAAIPQSSVKGNPRRRSKGAQRQIDEGGYTAKDVGMLVAENIPGVGEAILARDIATDVSKGNYASAALGTAALGVGIFPGGDILNKPIKAAAKKLRKQDTDVANKMLKDVESIETWKKQNPNPKPQKQNPDIEKAANDLLEGDITGKQYRSVVKENMPIVKIDEVPEVPSFTEIVGALDKDKSAKGIVGLNKTVEDGTRVASRLDIPAYERFDKWVVSVHDAFDKKGRESLNGDIIGYGKTAVLKNVEFKGSPTGAASISARKTNKSTIARIFGDYINAEPENVEEYARQVIKDKNWTQVGYNPFRHGFFYDKNTGMPVKSAEEVIQVGPLVLAKNAQKYKVSEAKQVGPKGGLKIRSGKPIEGLKNLKETKTVFNKGGTVMDRQMEMFEDGGLMDEGGTVDPVSGNDVPPGSMQEEVRDDIPAQLSEGEFVFPADVVRYIGLGNLMRIRQEAKMGLKMMEEMGQMGNSEEATMPDNLPFDINDLDMDDEPEYNVGGFVPGSQQDQQMGIAGYQAAPVQSTGIAATPIEAASQQFVPPPVARPAQAFVPVQTTPTPLPTFGQITGPGVPEVDFEFATFRNEAGQEIQLRIKKGSRGELLSGEVLPEGYSWVDPTATATEEVTTTPTTVQTAQVREDDPSDDKDPGFSTTDVTGIGYNRSKLTDDLRDVVKEFGFGFGALGETLNMSGAVMDAFGKDPRAKGASLTSAALGGVLDAFRGGDVTFSDPNRMGRKTGNYDNTMPLHEMAANEQNRIARVARTVVGDLRDVFVDGDGKTRTVSEVNARLSKLAGSLGIKTSVQGPRGVVFKSRSTIMREISEAQAKLAIEAGNKAAAEAAELRRDQMEIERAGTNNFGLGDLPTPTDGDPGESGRTVTYDFGDSDDGPVSGAQEYSIGTGEDGSVYTGGAFGGSPFGGFAEGGLASKKKPKVKKMKRGGLASKK